MGPGTGPIPGDSSNLREWTSMVYLARDNNLEEYGRRNLTEMKEAGCTPQVAIAARAVRRAQRFSDEDYKDLYDLCRLLAERSGRLPELK